MLWNGINRVDRPWYHRPRLSRGISGGNKTAAELAPERHRRMRSVNDEDGARSHRRRPEAKINTSNARRFNGHKGKGLEEEARLHSGSVRRRSITDAYRRRQVMRWHGRAANPALEQVDMPRATAERVAERFNRGSRSGGVPCGPRRKNEGGGAEAVWRRERK